MPIMPFPISRNASVVAIEGLLNTPDARDVVTLALDEVATGARPDLAWLLLAHATGQDRSGPITLPRLGHSVAYDAVATAMAAVGKDWSRSPDPAISDLKLDLVAIEEAADPGDLDLLAVQRGVAHLDQHWFDPTNHAFWFQYEDGAPAVIIAQGLRQAIELSGRESLLPIHLTWVCASPTFEVAVSNVRRPGEPAVAISVTLSTPGTQMSLSHVRPEGQNASPPPDPRPSVAYGEDQWFFGARATKKNDGKIVQDNQPFTYQPGESPPGNQLR